MILANKIFVWIVGLILLVGIVSGATGDVVEQTDFEETGTPSGWENITGTLNFDATDYVKSGSQSAKFTRSETNAKVDHNNTASTANISFSFWARVDNTNYDAYFYEYNTELIGFHTDGGFYCFANSVDQCSASYAKDTWYYFVYNINRTANKANFYIYNSTGGLIESATGKAMNGAKSIRNEFTLNTNGNMWVDKFRSWEGGLADDPYPEFYISTHTTYNSSTIEGGEENFILNASWNTAVVNNISYVGLVWNGTEYATTKNSFGSNWSYHNYTGLSIPQVSAITSVNFYWKINYTLVNTSNTTQNTLNISQKIYKIALTNCTSGNRTLNFTIKNEEDDSIIVSDLDAIFTISNNDIARNYSFSLTNRSTYSFCISPDFENYSSNATISYGTTGYSTREYYLTDVYLTNTTQNITLYLINSSLTTDVYLIVKDSYFDAIPNVIIKILRYYIGDNEFKTIEESKTDINGYAISRLIENDINYKFILEQEGEIIYTSSAMRIVCVDIPCTKEFIITGDTEDYFYMYEGISGLTYSVDWNNATKMLSLTFNDNTGLTPTIRFPVIRDSITGNTTICNNTLTSTAGTIYCNLTGYTDGTFFWKAGRATSPEVIFAWGSFSISELWRIFGDEGIFWSWIVTLSFGAIGFWNAGVGIGLVILSAIGLSYLNWVNFSYYILMMIVILGLVIMAFIRKRDTA